MNIFNDFLAKIYPSSIEDKKVNSNAVSNTQNKRGNNGIIDELPDDVVAIILSFTPDHELKNISLINKNFYDASQSEGGKDEMNRFPMAAQVQRLFNRESPTPNFKNFPGKIFKEENGTVNVLISDKLKPEEANFTVERMGSLKNKPNENLVQRIVSSLSQSAPAMQKYNIRVLDKEMDKDLKKFIDQGQKILNTLVENYKYPE